MIYLNFSSEINSSELFFIFSLQNINLHNNFNQKIVHKVIEQNSSSSLFVTSKSAALCTTHKPPAKLSIFLLLAVSN